MNEERDIFLTKIIGKELTIEGRYTYVLYLYAGGPKVIVHNFDTWEGFGKLLEWCNRQSWFSSDGKELAYWHCSRFALQKLNPSDFANEISDYLKES